LKYGFSAFEYPSNTSFVNEKKEKFQFIESLRQKKELLKSNKIKKIKEDIEDELANKEKIGMKTFVSLCLAEDINILFIHKRKCYQQINNLDGPIHIVHQVDKPYVKYGFEFDCSKEKVESYTKNYFFWENVEKPLKAISYYKIKELQDLCKKLEIDCSDKNKKDMYELLILNM
jgi:hypothetical protein